MIKYLKLALLSIAIVMTCSCSAPSASFYPLQPNAPQSYGTSKEPSAVEVFITKKPIYQYQELGMITYEALSAQSDEPAIYNILRAKAAEIGADAIIIMTPQSSIEQFTTPIYDRWGALTENNITRSIIKYRAMAIKIISK